jgi:hypothetical protein
MTKRSAAFYLREKLEAFDRLPDDAIVDDLVSAALLNISVWTLKRTNPVPERRITERRGGRRAGDLREKIRGSTV